MAHLAAHVLRASFGAFGMPLWQMAIGAFIGSAPRAFVYTALGASISDLSSPLKITRGADFQSLNVRGLYPAGEGASYAGGILSAGVDGIKVAEAVACSIAAR